MNADAEAKARALAYLERNGTRLPLTELRQKLQAVLHGIEDLLLTAENAEARSRPATGRWRVQEVSTT